jgi:hypothetical protein
MTSNNPLSQYFRQPAIYIKLPSQGNYYPPGTLDMPLNKELPVFPMTAIDEITYRTPDALFNGQAVVNVIQSCLPNIKDAWAIPATDIDTILVAIRIATYGHQMDFTTVCPKCNNDEEYGIDLRVVLDTIRTPDYSQAIKQGDIEIYFKPMSYKNMSDNNRMQFDEQRLLQNLNVTIENPDMAQINAISAALKKMTEMTVGALSQSILTIKTPSAIVTESEFIQEFMRNCDRSIFNRIQEYIIEHKRQAEMQPINIDCKNCSNEYSQQLTLDMSNFFGRAS